MRERRLMTLEEISALVAELGANLSAEDRAALELNHAKFLADCAVLDAKHAANMRGLWVDFAVVCGVCLTAAAVAVVNANTWQMDAVRYTCSALCALVALRSAYRLLTAKARSRKLYGLDKL